MRDAIPDRAPRLRSIFAHAVDARRRIQIPREWQSRASEELIVISLGGHLLALPPAAMFLLETYINAQDQWYRENILLSREIALNSMQSRLERDGRLIIPEEFLLRAGIRREAVLAGLIDRFQIWSPERYADQRKMDGEYFLETNWPAFLYERQDAELHAKERTLITDMRSVVKQYFRKHPEKLYDISPRDFEKLVAEILRDMGFDVVLTKVTRDGGVDIYA
jgi:DNA-binding transcriptional regulator/RsmH inhibitor MraZ